MRLAMHHQSLASRATLKKDRSDVPTELYNDHWRMTLM